MAQRKSGYERKENDAYFTPAWVTETLLPHIPSRIKHVWEPAAGSGKMVSVLVAAGYEVSASSLETETDFLDTYLGYYREIPDTVDAIITNPPYGKGMAQKFIEHALDQVDFVAMLLPVNYDCAMTRQHLFGNCPHFVKKIVLTRRIVFFERPGAAPSENHAWYLWDKLRFHPTILGYEPCQSQPCLPEKPTRSASRSRPRRKSPRSTT